MRKHYKIIVFLLVLLISVGFAYLTTTLDITGSIIFKDNVWDVHLENLEVESNSVDADTPTITDGNNLDFNVTLTRPGDYYEFYVDVVNSGTMDATLDTFTKTKLTGDYATYLNYSTTYYSDRAITKGDLLRSGLKERIKVRVEYKYDVEDYKKLENIKLSFSLQYIKTDIHNANYNELVWNFDSKAEEDIFTAPKTGKYKLEVWGAQGGYTVDVTKAYGGYGGYSVGTLNLTSLEKVYINVGSTGESLPTRTSIAQYLKGGYNGGGIGKSEPANNEWTTGGGGATHIATTFGTLPSLDSNRNSILIVAGGGGGGGACISDYLFYGGSGGGMQGNNGVVRDGTSNNRQLFGYGGTQTSGGLGSELRHNEKSDGLFGQGASPDYGSGGGGGYYGGGAGYWYGGSAGGGSGYIGNPNLTDKVMYCYNCQESTEASTKTVSTTNVSETPTSNYAKIGHGYARITFVS